MTVQRVGGVDVATVALTPDGLLVLDDYLRTALRTDTRTTGARLGVLRDVVQAVNSAAVSVAELRRAERACSEGGSRTAPAANGAPGRGSASSDRDPAGSRRSSRSAATSVSGRTPPAGSGPAWVSAEEAAERIGCTTRWVQRLAKAGRLTARRSGRGAWEFDPAAVAMWSPTPQF